MQEDEVMSPGRKDYWDHFYDADDGVLSEKQRCLNRRLARGKSSTTNSVLDHYEWFTTYDVYGDILTEAMETCPVSSRFGKVKKDHNDPDGVIRVLHVGCGNSDFSDHFTEVRRCPCEVLNVDICESLIQRLKTRFPKRLYTVGDCCNMTEQLNGTATSWWREVNGQLKLSYGAVDMIFDKGTMDALLSAFPGEDNPNAQAFATECLRALKPGGINVIISINSSDVLMPYYLGAGDNDASKWFELSCSKIFDVSQQFKDTDDAADAEMRVETLGVRYTLYVLTCASDECE